MVLNALVAKVHQQLVGLKASLDQLTDDQRSQWRDGEGSRLDHVVTRFLEQKPPLLAPEPGEPERIAQYRILNKLGQGGMGEVYAAFDEYLQRKVALKCIRTDLIDGVVQRARFLREARVLSGLDHPGICRIFDFLQTPERDYIVLEFVEGDTLGRRLREGLSAKLRWQIAEQLVHALAAAHQAGILHRDLKPANIILTPDGQAKILDFGLATLGERSEASADRVESPTEDADAGASPRPGLFENAGLTAQGAVVGTLPYMSPEQARAEPLSTKSDVYSLGLILRELFGAPPAYPANLDTVTMLDHVREGRLSPLSGIGGGLRRCLAPLLQKDPAARPSASEVALRLASLRTRWIRWARRGAAALLLVAAVAFWAKYTVDLEAERSRAVKALEVASIDRGRAVDTVEFLLNDLEPALVGVGRQDLLDILGDRVLTYFEQAPGGELTRREVLRRSLAFGRISNLRVHQGDLPAAMQAAETSLDIAERLRGDEPDDAELLHALGQAHFYVGQVHYERGENEAAEASWRRYLELTRLLVDAEPDVAKWQVELAYGHANLGGILQAQGEQDQALEEFLASDDLWIGLIDTHPDEPDHLRDRANTLSWIASAREKSGRREEALETFVTEYDLRLEMADLDPRNKEWQYLLVICQGHVGRLAAKLGDEELGLEHLQTALDLAEELHEFDPDNATWTRTLAVTQYEFGRGLKAFGHLDEARSATLDSIDLLERLVEQDRTNQDWRNYLNNARGELRAIEVLAEDSPP